MIRRSKGWLRWGEEDVVAMASILGPDTVSKGYTAIQDSVLKAAQKRGVLLTPGLERRLTEAKAERLKLKQTRQAKPDLIEYPPARVRKLFVHQREALAYMRMRHAYLLADQPGVGKTPVAILWGTNRAIWAKSSAYERFSSERMVTHPHTYKKGLKRRFGPLKGYSGGPRALVITPNSAKRQWAREIARWTPGADVTIVDGTKAEQSRIAAEANGWIVGHWESLVHARDGMLEREWDVVILDEAHHIRNRNAQRTETAFKLVGSFRLCLTGHPFFNSPDELWSILRFLYPEEYTSFWRFFSMHVLAVPQRFGGFEITGVRNPKLLRWELMPFSLRRTKRRVFKSLPSILRTPRHLELSRRARREYDKLKKELFVELAGREGSRKILVVPSVLARVTRIRQYLVDPGLLGAKEKSLKYPAVHELIQELDGPPVVFTMFRQAATRLDTYLRKRDVRVGMIHGKIKEADRARWQERFLVGKLDVLIVVTQAGGTALNLGKYGYVIFLDMPWTAADLEQAEGRVDRPEEGTGKMVSTTSYRLVIRDTYEEKLEELLERKHGMFEEVFTTKDLEVLFK